MGRAARANQQAQAAARGEVKHVKPETPRHRRDRLRTTLPNFTRNQMLLYLGLVEPKKQPIIMTKVDDGEEAR